MGEIDENPVLDYDELNSYIQGRTGLDYDTVANVLDLETEYMIKGVQAFYPVELN